MSFLKPLSFPRRCADVSPLRSSDIKPENLLFSPIEIEPSLHPTSRQYDEDKVDEGLYHPPSPNLPSGGAGGIGLVKLADFGLSKVVWEEETATPCGTVGYTAPEIVKDERYSKSVDMWALGCVLYTLLCGFPPVSSFNQDRRRQLTRHLYSSMMNQFQSSLKRSPEDTTLSSRHGGTTFRHLPKI